MRGAGGFDPKGPWSVMSRAAFEGCSHLLQSLKMPGGQFRAVAPCLTFSPARVGRRLRGNCLGCCAIPKTAQQVAKCTCCPPDIHPYTPVSEAEFQCLGSQAPLAAAQQRPLLFCPVSREPPDTALPAWAAFPQPLCPCCGLNRKQIYFICMFTVAQSGRQAEGCPH